MTTECVHNWKMGKVNAGVCHGECKKCGEEQDFPQYGDPAEAGPKHTPQIGSPTKRANVQERHRFYEEHKAEILADIEELGRQATLKKWNMPGGSMVGLLRRWKPGAPPPPRPRTDEDALGRLDKAIEAVQASIRSFEEKRREIMRQAGASTGGIYKEKRRLKVLQDARAVVLEVMGKGGETER